MKVLIQKRHENDKEFREDIKHFLSTGDIPAGFCINEGLNDDGETVYCFEDEDIENQNLFFEDEVEGEKYVWINF